MSPEAVVKMLSCGSRCAFRLLVVAARSWGQRREQAPLSSCYCWSEGQIGPHLRDCGLSLTADNETEELPNRRGSGRPSLTVNDGGYRSRQRIAAIGNCCTRRSNGCGS